MYTRLQLCLGAGAVLLALTLDGNTLPAVQPKSAPKGTHASVLAQLHQAKHLLDIGLHDYQGHRARADQEIFHAIHLLEHHHHHKGVHKTHHTVVHHGHITEQLQQQSDTKLRSAEKLVQAAQYQLVNMNSGATKGQHKHVKEAEHLLTKAVNEIEKALHVVHHYNDHHKKAQVLAK